MSFGKIAADVQKSGNGLIMTFDASKLLTLMNTVAKLTGKQTLQAAATFLNSYDGLNCGFSLTKTGSVGTAGNTSTQQQETPDSTGQAGGLGSLLDMLKKR